ncbi:MAG TPA: serine/threonine-protein kinase [Polyangia bacterium]|nr:serine/threonine-protein kinase [Polyangia bacterium]
MSKCPHCSTELEDGARFCGACGKKVDPPAAAPPEEAAAAPAPARRGDISGTIRPLNRDRKPDSKPTAIGSGALESAAMTIFQSAKGAGAGPAPTTAPSAAADASLLATVPAPAAANPPVRPPAQAPENLIGRTLNHRYLIEDKIGEGGFGAVFRGKQIATGREVALKILHPHNSSDQTIIARFRREAEACSKLRDTHTVTTYDFDETEDGILYLAMELLRGRSLHHLQKADGILAPERVLSILDQVAQSLGEAHANGIVHRDMKPENVFIESRQVTTGSGSKTEDHVKVLDFGIAKVMSGEKEVQALTAVGQTLGTLEFMSPEQLRGQKLDGRSDIYALGMMSYEMLTGVLPFQGAKSPIEIINFHMKTPAPPPSELKEGLKIPQAVDDIIVKMVAKNREDRFADTNALRAAIAKAQKVSDRSADKTEGYRVVAVIAATLVVVGILVFVLTR